MCLFASMPAFIRDLTGMCRSSDSSDRGSFD